MGKSVLVGALVAILLVACVGLGGYLYLRSVSQSADSERQSRVVLVFESPAEDGALSAALISLVVDDRMKDVSPETTVTIPGTSYHHLSDALVFGGGAAVASALDASQSARPAAFVVVPQSVWGASLDATHAVRVNLSSDVTVFDGEELITIHSGQQSLTATGVVALLRGLPYIALDERSALRKQIERQLAAAVLVARPLGDGLVSDLSPKALGSWMGSSLTRAVIAPVD